MIIDARGLRCPWPALRLARALREGHADQLTVLADDPIAPRELAEVAVAAGWALAADEERADTFIVSRKLT